MLPQCNQQFTTQYPDIHQYPQEQQLLYDNQICLVDLST